MGKMLTLRHAADHIQQTPGVHRIKIIMFISHIYNNVNTILQSRQVHSSQFNVSNGPDGIENDEERQE